VELNFLLCEDNKNVTKCFLHGFSPSADVLKHVKVTQNIQDLKRQTHQYVEFANEYQLCVCVCGGGDSVRTERRIACVDPNNQTYNRISKSVSTCNGGGITHSNSNSNMDV